jgi:hypothetical protein
MVGAAKAAEGTFGEVKRDSVAKILRAACGGPGPIRPKSNQVIEKIPLVSGLVRLGDKACQLFDETPVDNMGLIPAEFRRRIRGNSARQVAIPGECY